MQRASMGLKPVDNHICGLQIQICGYSGPTCIQTYSVCVCACVFNTHKFSKRKCSLAVLLPWPLFLFMSWHNHFWSTKWSWCPTGQHPQVSLEGSVDKNWPLGSADELLCSPGGNLEPQRSVCAALIIEMVSHGTTRTLTVLEFGCQGFHMYNGKMGNAKW